MLLGRNVAVVLLLALAGCATVSAAPEEAHRRPIPPRIPEVITPVVATALAEPHAVTGADGLVHLPYELFVTNPSGSVMTITKIETLDVSGSAATDPTPSHPKVIDVLRGAALDDGIDPLVPSATKSIQPAQ